MTYILIISDTSNQLVAHQLKTLLEQEGFSTWENVHGRAILGDSVSLADDSLRLASALVVVGTNLEPEQRDVISEAQALRKPIYALKNPQDSEALVEKLKQVFPQLTSLPIPLPKPLDVYELSRLTGRSEKRSGSTSAVFLLILVGFALLVTIGVVIFLSQATQSRTTGGSTATLPATVTQALTSEATVVELVSTASREATLLPTRTTSASEVPTQLFTPTREATLIPSRTRVSATPSQTNTPTQTLTPSREATLIPSQTHTRTVTPTATLTPTPYNENIPPFDSTPMPMGFSNLRWRPVDFEFSGIEMVFVPAGCFGLLEGQILNETCVESFWISRYEITNAEYAACVDAGACVAPLTDQSRTHADYFLNPEYADYPVVNITWEQATDFGQWIGGDLPTDVQWRYAAQGPSNWTFPWGEEAPRSTLLNYNGLIGDTNRVGSYELGVSWVGAYDMAGNVWEWTSTAPSPMDRVICGGSWNSFAGLVNAAYLATTPLDDANHYTGFRVALPVYSPLD
ncbi:MAG: SUMF1/EgtB/PvdO family nonheme iron enzyme [Anaerolinea sp.]|nr:SUMF1/EgtB/PvdO family nonheme iron enzyme [Anaerolinea sp.]